MIKKNKNKNEDLKRLDVHLSTISRKVGAKENIDRLSLLKFHYFNIIDLNAKLPKISLFLIE